ncbi:hypothetical protein SAMN04487852_103178 [Prevotella sp. tf2-5]|jgi:hypothetical protein|nr:hypothetical protein SAMN04487852_103178 [Prevotella sp. tf2-5]
MVLRKDLSQNLFSLFFCIFATENVSQSRSEKTILFEKEKNLPMSLVIHIFFLPL